MKRTTAEPGGTAVVEKGFPISAVVVAIAVAAAIILVFGLRGGHKKTEAAPAPMLDSEVAVGSAAPVVRPQAAPVAVAPVAPVAAPAAQDPRAAIAALEDVLRRQRLWGRAQVTGSRVDVRSGSCGDKGMAPAIASAATVLHGAGLTKLRCLEQSGAVVFERDL
jgi:hypothetical protein